MEENKILKYSKIIIFGNFLLFTILVLITAILLIIDWTALFKYAWTHLMLTFFIILVIALFIVGIVGVAIDKSIMVYSSWVNSIICTTISVLTFIFILQLSQQETCPNTINYLSWKLQSVDTAADTLFCSYCQCSQQDNMKGKARVQQCPSWVQNNYTPILAMLQDNLECSGWCKQSTTSYYKYTNSLNTKPIRASTCHLALQKFISQRKFSFFVAPLVLIMQLMINTSVTGIYLFMLQKLQKNDKKDKIQKDQIKINPGLPDLLGLDSKQM